MDKMIFLGKNYPDHAAELGELQPEKPVVFLKPPSILRASHDDGNALELICPGDRGELHHEVEIVFRLDRGGYQMDPKEAEKALGSVTLGLDMTLREIQKEAKAKGLPWTPAKVFPDSAVVGPWIRISEFPEYLDQKFSLAIDDQIIQESYGKKMLMNPVDAVVYLSRLFPLKTGDLIFTGTPTGVGPVFPGSKGLLSYGPIRYSVIWKPSPSQGL
jgi:2-keto-4-pentenoate hydratase/2-oxohepta-3-ene-1,7-dioic acid hydratase in catechol pathway